MWKILKLKSSRSVDATFKCCTLLAGKADSIIVLPSRALPRCHRNSRVCTTQILQHTPNSNASSKLLNPSKDSHTDRHEYQGRRSKFWKSLFTAGGILGGLTLLISTLSADDHDEVSDKTLDPRGKAETSVTNFPDQAKTDSDAKVSLSKAIDIGRDLAQRIKDETGSPGLAVAVSVDGKTVWSEGLGYADVENRLPCKPETVLRIASISKSITMAAVAKLWEKGDLDLDKPVQHYVPEFPEKTWNGEKVTITTRQLLSQLGGIRHYDKSYMKKNQSKEPTTDTYKKDQKNENSGKLDAKSKAGKDKFEWSKDPSQSPRYQEMEEKEYYIMEKYDSVIKSLNLFKDDPLVNKPGTEFYYTTHGWTLISAVAERAAKMPFEKYMRSILYELGLKNTHLEQNEPLIYSRGRHYVKNKRDRLVNAPYTDLSYKWAGGGLVSNVLDVVKFGNAMLYSYQATECHGKENSQNLKGFLEPETMKAMWTKVDKTKLSWGGIAGGGYGLGWGVWDLDQNYGYCKEGQFFVSHTGGAIGGSSVLLILPAHTGEHLANGESGNQGRPPKGVVVSIIVNMVSVGLMQTAFNIARTFENLDKNAV